MGFSIQVIFISLLLLIGGCRFGARPQAYLKAAGPLAELQFHRGIDAEGVSRVLSRGVHHELLAISDQGLLILTRGKIVEIQYSALKSYRYKTKTHTFSKKDPISVIKEKIMGLGNGNFAFLVRFPQGVSAALLESLLQSYGQDQLIVVSSE